MLTEASYYDRKDRYLFHSTRIRNAMGIASSGVIRADTSHVGMDAGVSLTRSWWYAEGWKDIVFVLDPAKMPNRLMNVSWRPHHGEDDPGDEKEVFAIGKIVLSDDVLLSINLTRPYALERAQQEPHQWTRVEPSVKETYLAELDSLLNHPKWGAISTSTLAVL
jgi:hypothetical protein